MSNQNNASRWMPTVRWWVSKLVGPALFLAAGILLLTGLGVAQRYGWLTSDAGSSQAAATVDTIHTCPMHPQIRQPEMGRCPICGMELVPAAAASGSEDGLSITIPSAQRRLANIQVARVERSPVTATLRTVGEIAIDESRMATISSYASGRLERLFADYTGVTVAAQDHLAVIYSPELYAAQVEYLQSRKTVSRSSGATLDAVRQTQQKLLKNSRQKLVELGMQDWQLEELETSGEAKSRLTIYSPVGGTVTEKLAMDGKYVEAGEPIYRIADLSTVWLMLELYPEDAARVRYGQRVEAEMQSLPGQLFNGRVAFVEPTVDRSKRTVGVRVEFLNDDRTLRPGDYANATVYLQIGQRGEVYDADLAGRWISPMHPQIISDQPGQCSICGMDLVPTSRYGYAPQPVAQPTALHIPRSALLMAGESSVVYVEQEPGRFEVRVVTVGPILGDKVVVLSGLREGELVATAGNFLIDSQMQLAGKPSLIDPTRAIAAKEERNTPLELAEGRLRSVPGEAGQHLESLFEAYFQIQETLAADRALSREQVTRLVEATESVSALAELNDEVRSELENVLQHAAQLEGQDLDAVRHESFRPISHAIVTLASLARGEMARQPFHHIFCPMVKGGAGDWLQTSRRPVNPYWGSQMLNCGEHVRELQAASPSAPEGAPK